MVGNSLARVLLPLPLLAPVLLLQPSPAAPGTIPAGCCSPSSLPVHSRVVILNLRTARKQQRSARPGPGQRLRPPSAGGWRPRRCAACRASLAVRQAGRAALQAAAAAQHVLGSREPHAPPSGPSRRPDAAVRRAAAAGRRQPHGALPGPPGPAAARRSPRPAAPAHLQLLPCTTKRPRRAGRPPKWACGDPDVARCCAGRSAQSTRRPHTAIQLLYLRTPSDSSCLQAAPRPSAPPPSRHAPCDPLLAANRS